MIDFFVPGIPRVAGSKRAFVNRKTGHVAIVEQTAEATKDWKATVRQCAVAAFDSPLLDEPLRVLFEFHFVRPLYHWGAGRNAHKLKPSAPSVPSKSPDLTKIIRSTEDALTGIIYRDDALIVDQRAVKIYSQRPGCHIVVQKYCDEPIGICSDVSSAWPDLHTAKAPTP